MNAKYQVWDGRNIGLAPADAETYHRLKSVWLDAYGHKLANDDDETANRDEQDAWDAWVDWVEDHNLNWTHYDPRGPEDTQVTVIEWVL